MQGRTSTGGGAGFSTRLAMRGVAPPAAAVLAFLAALSTRLLNDGDSWWHVAAGRLMIARRAVIHSDPFSYTFAGAAWHTHEWLAQILLGGAFGVGGWSAVVILTAAAMGLTAWLLGRDLSRWVDGLPLLCLVALGLGLGTGSLLARPHMLALPILEIWTAELIRARAEARSPRWIVLPLMALWANLHGSFMFGLALIGPFALEALLAAPSFGARRDVVLRWGTFGLAAAAMAVISPDGVGTLLFPIQLLGMKSLAHIGEWAPASFATVGPLEVALLATLFVAITRPLRLPVIRALLLLLLLYLALQHTRYEQMLGVIGALILAAPMARAFGQGADAAASGERPARTPILTTAALSIALLLAAGRLAWPVVLGDDVDRPASALAAVPAATRQTHVLNEYSFGGYLIGHGVAPFIDSRADLYGDAWLEAYDRLIRPDRAALAATLDARQIGWTLFKAGSPVADAMDEMPGWRRLYADRWAVVHVRR
ncbi:hypothetical protein [Phenylobacterium sp.]|jgi:hypothetical protein|uniref:hypothetical protein n=1 Tax=Phenylobacterium sp. TaxID=1871053 RepID=UPI002E32B9E7|nr:hypothetical protein [Phenylobacterium sp.]HEX3367117.1 hypothetical protein [Phenylobacterium sp.]